MCIDIICPLYNAEKYILNLDYSLKMQKRVKINKIIYILTDCKDRSEEILIKNKIKYKKIKKSEFSHSLTREKAALESKADIICFITQDIVIEDNEWLYNLTKNIIKEKCVASFSRQISKFNNIEKYTREKNYPDKDRVMSKNKIKELGLNTFFFSDASSAIKTEIYKKLNGYDGKNLPINEDMYFAFKLIMNNYKICYESQSIVYHSHNFSLKELYQRYKLIGQFFKENPYLNEFGTRKSGGNLAKYVLIRALQEKNFKVLLRYPFDMMTRFIGMKAGLR